MILAEHFPQNGPLHFQANNIPDVGILVVEENQSFMLDYNEPKKQSAFEIPTPCLNILNETNTKR